jgi:hypothetical protein
MGEKEDLLAKAKEAASKLGKNTISKSEFSRFTGISSNRVYKHFEGFRDFMTQAGLVPDEQKVRLEEDQIFSAMRDTFVELGSIVTRMKFDKHFRYSVDVFKKRGLNWSATLAAFRKWVELNDPTFPYLEQLPEEGNQSNSASDSATPLLQPHSNNLQTWSSIGGRQFGEFISFRGLLHAPINEQGVVFLFGMLAAELGFVVEMVTTGFPDCEATRRVGKERWERTRIEFEYQSRNFSSHGHDPNGCDLIVCWEHNWPDCPVEVLELKTSIKNLALTK